MKSAPGIAFDYRPSRAIAIGAMVIVAAAVFAAWANDLPPGVRFAVATAALAVGFASMSRFMRPSFRRVAYRSSGWIGIDGAGEERLLALAAHVQLGSWLALDFRAPDRKRFRAIVGPGNLDAETRRRLIVLLARAEIARAG